MQTLKHGAVTVTRISTKEQTEPTSPAIQLDKCRAKAVELGIAIVAEYGDRQENDDADTDTETARRNYRDARLDGTANEGNQSRDPA